MPDQRLLGALLSLFDSSLYRQIYPNCIIFLIKSYLSTG